MGIEDTIDDMLRLEKKMLKSIKDGTFGCGVDEYSTMRITGAIQWKIDLLEELKSELE